MSSIRIPAGRMAAGALRAAWRGRVSAVHRHAAHLALDSGAVVGLLGRGLPLHPWAVSMAALAAEEGEDGKTGEDEENGWLGAGVALLDGALHAGSASIPLDALDPVDLSLPASVASFGVEWAGVLAELAEQAELQVGTSPKDPFEAKLRTALNRFVREADPVAIAGLIGLGGGLTPSGDDILTGALAALDLRRRAGAAATAGAMRMALGAALPRRLEEATPRVSAQMIQAAAEGQYPKPLLDLARTAGRSDAERSEISAAARHLLALGHTSGRDLLRGFAAGLLVAGENPGPIHAGGKNIAEKPEKGNATSNSC